MNNEQIKEITSKAIEQPIAALSRNRLRFHGIQIGNSAFSRTDHG